MCTTGEKQSPFELALVVPRSTPALPVVPSQSCVLGGGPTGSVRPQMCHEIEPLKELTPLTPIVALSCTLTSALAGAAGMAEAGGLAWLFASTGVVVTSVWHSPSWLVTKSNSVAVVEVEERVSGTTVLKQLGAVWPPACWNTLVMLIPPSKKSGETIWFLPTLDPFAVSHGVATVWFHCLLQPRVAVVQLAFVVAQSESPPPATLQSAVLVEIGWPLQPPVAEFGLSFESMQPPSPESGPLAAAAH